MDETVALGDQLLVAFDGALRSTVAALPRVLLGLLLLVLALLVAKCCEWILRGALRRLHFDTLMAKLGLDKSLERLGISAPAHRLVSRVIYFLLLFLFARTAAEALGLSAVAEAMGAFLAYLPRLVAAVVILILGSLGGQVAGRAVGRMAAGAGIDFGSSLGSLASALILFVAGIMALSQLRIETEIIRIVTLCCLAGLALAFGLSLGLGTRDITRSILAGFYARKIFRVGDEMEIRGERGVLKVIGPTQTLLEHEGRTVAIANSVFLEDVARQ